MDPEHIIFIVKFLPNYSNSISIFLIHCIIVHKEHIDELLLILDVRKYVLQVKISCLETFWDFWNSFFIHIENVNVPLHSIMKSISPSDLKGLSIRITYVLLRQSALRFHLLFEQHISTLKLRFAPKVRYECYSQFHICF